MRVPALTEERRRNISFLAGIAFLTKFALWTPAALNPLLTALIAACIFGPGVVSMFSQSGKDNKSDEPK